MSDSNVLSQRTDVLGRSNVRSSVLGRRSNMQNHRINVLSQRSNMLM